MDVAYTPILGTLGYIMSPDGASVLMIHRNTRPMICTTENSTVWAASLTIMKMWFAGLRREIREEAGIEAEELVLRGTISWPGFGKHGRGLVRLYLPRRSLERHTARRQSRGTLEWVPLTRLPELNLWESDRLWIDMVFEHTPKMFHGIAPYQDGKLLSWAYTLI